MKKDESHPKKGCECADYTRLGTAAFGADAAFWERGSAVPTQFPISKTFRHGDILGLGELELGRGASGKSHQHPLPDHWHVPGAGEVQGHGERERWKSLQRVEATVR